MQTHPAADYTNNRYAFIKSWVSLPPKNVSLAEGVKL
jgi:hypothetical protein